MRLTFLGGAGTVTGSRYLVEAGGVRLLVDCGLFQGGRKLRQRNWQDFPVDPATIDAVLISHAHIDHTGYLPKLVRDGFRGPIFATEATCSLLEIMLLDAAHIQEQDAAYANHRGYSRHQPALPLYTMADAELALSQLESVKFGELTELEAFEARWLQAGHILGSAILELSRNGHRIAFSGDLGRYDSPIMKPPSIVNGANTVVMESTYGDRLHREDNLDEVLVRAVNHIADRKGMLLIPAFAVGRTQQVLYHLRRLQDCGVLPNIPVHVDSPMAVDVSEIYCRHGNDHTLDVSLLMDEHSCPLRCHQTHFVRSVEESKALNRADGPGIVISASGMCTAGRILHHLKWRLPHRQNAVLFVGFQAAGTRGRRLLDGASRTRIHGDDVPVKAGIYQLHALSAHGDQEDLLRWFGELQPTPERLFLVHGEPEGSQTLADRIRSVSTTIPSWMDSVVLSS